MKKENLDAFFRRGSMKIGTLHEYRQVEQYGKVIGDQHEGLHITEFSLSGGGEVDLSKNTPEADFFRKHVMRPDQQNSNVKLVFQDGARIMVHSSSVDLYIYCMTSEFNHKVMSLFKCDACMEITNPTAFFHAISRKIRHQGKLDGWVAIQYASKETHYTKPHQHNPAVLKDLNFSYQKEWRAIWVPQKTKVQPIYIDVPKAIRHCKIHFRN
jgi:hypothetical protein